MTNGTPDVGELVRTRGQQWLVSEVLPSALPADELAASQLPGDTLVTLTSLGDVDAGRDLTVVGCRART